MTFFEKTTDPRDLLHWKGNMEATYLYTSGHAGEDFFRALMDGKFIGNECPKCGKVYVPPMLYCEDCFVEIGDNYREFDGTGRVQYYTVARMDTYGKESEDPEVWAVIIVNGADSGFTHKVDADPEEVESGLEVEPVLRPKNERRGTIRDIKCFRPK